MIIELHGSQHYKARGFMEDQTDNDTYKRNLASENGIIKYYEVDCRKSVFSFIKDNIMLIEDIDWSNINWDTVSEKAELDIVKAMCDYKREHPEASIGELSELFEVSTHAVRTYIEKGSDLGWCDYNFRELQYKTSSERYKGKGNPNPSKTI